MTAACSSTHPLSRAAEFHTRVLLLPVSTCWRWRAARCRGWSAPVEETYCAICSIFASAKCDALHAPTTKGAADSVVLCDIGVSSSRARNWRSGSHSSGDVPSDHIDSGSTIDDVVTAATGWRTASTHAPRSVCDPSTFFVSVSGRTDKQRASTMPHLPEAPKPKFRQELTDYHPTWTVTQPPSNAGQFLNERGRFGGYDRGLCSSLVPQVEKASRLTLQQLKAERRRAAEDRCHANASSGTVNLAARKRTQFNIASHCCVRVAR